MIFLRALLGLSIASQAYAFTYYLHESCEGKITEDVITEVKKMAEEGGNRLRDDNDKVMADAFKRIFRVDRSPEAEGFTTATTVFDAIKSITQTDDLKAADVRIYCDNDEYGKDKRWKLVPDLPGAGKKSKNSKKPLEQQSFWDDTNYIYRKQGSFGCQDKKVDTLAQTYGNDKTRENAEGKGADQNPKRQTITFCDYAFSAPDEDGVPHLIKDVADKDLVKALLEDYDNIVSLTLFHEFCHLEHTIEAPGSHGDEPNGFGEILELEDDDEIPVTKAADTYAFLGLLGVLNSRNIRLINEDESKQEDKKLDSSLAYIDESKAPKEEKRSLMAGMSLHARGLTSVHVGSVSKRAMVFVS